MLWPCMQFQNFFPDWSGSLVSDNVEQNSSNIRLGLQKQNLQNICGSRLPKTHISPNAATFVYRCLGYGIFVLLYYNLHQYHRCQQHILGLGVLVGLILSYYPHLNGITLNMLTAIIPASVTFALILNTVIHSIAGVGSYTEEEKMFRTLESWCMEASALHGFGGGSSPRTEPDQLEKRGDIHETC